MQIFDREKETTSTSHAIVMKNLTFTNDDSFAPVKGYSYEGNFNYSDYLETLKQTGGQSSHLGEAIDIIKEMLYEKKRLQGKMKIFLAFTSNIGSTGTREAITYLISNKMVDVIVATAGAVEEDIMKTSTPHFVRPSKHFCPSTCVPSPKKPKHVNPVSEKDYFNDHSLREEGLNRIYNVLVPNGNYVLFEEFMNPILDQMVLEQKKVGKWTPSKFIDRLGQEIKNNKAIDGKDKKGSWVLAAHERNIPVFSPAIVDGSIGDMIYFHQNGKRDLIMDTVGDLCDINSIPIEAEKTGVVILGGGLVKHHTLNANLMRNGTDFCVMVNCAIEADGSDASAGPEEAMSWGKIGSMGRATKIFSEVSLVLPALIVGGFKPFEGEFK